MTTIKENESIIGTGSWYVTQSYNDYRDKMELNDYLRWIQEQCENRVEFLSLKVGDRIKLTYLGGFKPRNYTGEITCINSNIHIQQKSREVSFDICLIDDIVKLPKEIKEDRLPEQNSRVISLKDYRNK